MEWISVEDQLPDDGQYVQVYLSYGKQATCVFFEDEGNCQQDNTKTNIKKYNLQHTSFKLFLEF